MITDTVLEQWANDPEARPGEKRLIREVERQRLVIRSAVGFLDKRREDGFDFPYDSFPLRMLRKEAGFADG